MIKIINNFFNKKDLIFFQNFAKNKAFYTPQFFNKSKEKNKQNFYGNRFHLIHEPKLLNLFKKQAELKFKIKIKKISLNSGIDLRNLDRFGPHTDEAKINILLMLDGPTAVTNGTVFYTENELDIHVGFRENRAILFPSNWMHSSHVSNIPNLKRYTITLFIDSYEE